MKRNIWARIDGRATKESECYCSQSWKFTQVGDYARAEQEIERAMAHLSSEEL